MLYPDFNELISFKDRNVKCTHPFFGAVRSAVAGNHHSAFRGRGLEFDSVREYVPGDDIRNIDWRVTARIGSPHLKIFKEERERQIILCIDMNCTMRFGTKKTFKSIQAARVAAFLGWLGIDQHHRVGMLLFGDVAKGIQYFPPTRVKNSFSMMLKMLTEEPIENPQIPIDEAVRYVSRVSHSGSLIYVISDLLNLNFHDETMANLKRKGDPIFISINDPADRAIPPVGTLSFCGYDQEKFCIDTNDWKGRKAYAELWNDNRNLLHSITSKWNIPLLELSTESNVPRDLILGIKGINKRKKL